MKAFWRIVRYPLLALLVFVVVYIAAVLLGGVLSVNRDYRAAVVGIPVYLQSNGVHIDLVLPVTAACACDARHAPTADILAQSFDPQLPEQKRRWLAVGWGDRQFMLGVPTWGDLTPGIALRAVSGLDGSVIRLSLLRAEPGVAPDTVRLLLTPSQYRALLGYIRQSAALPLQEEYSSMSGPEDRFYRSRDRYSLFNTCNEWVSRGLAQAGIRTPLWTPLQGALLRQAAMPD